MRYCPECDNLVRPGARCCPHCAACLPAEGGALRSTARAALMGLALGATACMPVAKYGMPDSFLPDSDTTDADGDGYEAEAAGGPDCDDSDAAIHPDAEETAGDGVDSNCDGADDT